MSFYLSKILWFIVNPFNIILSFIFLGIIFSFFSNKFFANFFYILSLIIFIIISVLPTGKFMFYQLEKRFHIHESLPEEIDGILILSGATNPNLTIEYNQISLNGSVERLFESIQLIKQYPNAKVIFAGGSGTISNSENTHAKIARMFFNKFGINTNRIIYENKSRNTYENILFAKKIVNPSNKEKWIIITSAFHMTRAINISKKLGWHFIPYAVDFRLPKNFSWIPSFNLLGNFSTFQSASHEWIGLIAYYFMGRSVKIY